MDNELFKLITRRYLAWGIGGLFTLTVAFITVWGAIRGPEALVTAGLGIIGVSVGAVIGFYFGKKTSEE